MAGRTSALSLPVEDRSRAVFQSYARRTPVFTFAAGGVLVSLTLPERVSAAHVEFAGPGRAGGGVRDRGRADVPQRNHEQEGGCMMREGYVSTWVANEPGRTRVSTSFYLDERAYVTLYPIGESRPFLSVELGDTHVDIGPRPEGRITDRDVEVFRDLAAKAAGLLAEVERMHAEQSEESGGAAA